MMKKILIFILLCSLFWLAESQVSQKELVELFKNLHDYPKTGYTVMTIIKSLGLKYGGDYEQAVNKFCDIFPVDGYIVCKSFVFVYRKPMIQYFSAGKTVDELCMDLELCSDPKCVLYPKDSTATPTLTIEPHNLPRFGHGEMSTWVKVILKAFGLHGIVETFKTHLPYDDKDKDLHSILPDHRGYAFRGRDCKEGNAEIYPGRKTGDVTIDHNCNGIYGVNPETGKPYEEELCADSKPRGVVIVGDSACAHFRVPPHYFNLSNASSYTYRHFMDLLKNELDWPHLSWATGFMNDTTGDNKGKVDSIYHRLRQRNLCNHRDYQNICVNGACSNYIASTLIKHIHRNKETDHPVLLFFAPIGNDVCDPSLQMTDPQVFHDNVVQSLDYLEETLPPESYVVFIGLVDGRILYKELHDKIHPAGVTYSQFYTFVTCIKANPCPQWMGTDEKLREKAAERVLELNAQYKKIIKERSHLYKSFKMIYLDFPLEEAIKQYVGSGGKIQDLIEPFDGFHPSLVAQNLIAKSIWEKLEKDYPEALGPVNPKNEEIARLFKKQGGH